MDKYVVRGVKKLFSLTRTKIRLAKDSNTILTRPNPLPIIEFLSDEKIGTVDKCEEYREKLKKSLDFSNQMSVAITVFELLDIIEGVKYKFEPEEYLTLIKFDELKRIEREAIKNSLRLNLLLLSEDILDGINLYIGNNPPEDAIHLGRVVSNIAFLLNFLFHSDYFYNNGKNGKFTNFAVSQGHKTLIGNAVYFSLGVFGANLL
ncbi:MAG: hypothetical protein DRO95_01535 [Candidatus Altiarchaeales archaeon]|nr:MAG: hypothetical protein DRO95_01535 [Candidatus Altiarchaeales archaeon]